VSDRTAPDLLETVLDDLPVGVVVQGPHAEIRYANRCALQLLGLTAEQTIGRTSHDGWDVVRLDGSPLPSDEHPAPVAIRTRQSVLDVTMGVRLSELGDRRWLLVSARPRLDEHGEVRDVLVTFSDVTTQQDHVEASERARELAERRMQEQADLLSATFRTMSEGVVLHGPDGSIRMANRAAARSLGLTPEQLTDRSPRDPSWGLVDAQGQLLPAEEIPSERTRFSGEPVRGKVLGVNVPGRGRSWLAVTTDPVNPDDDPPYHVVATFTDITYLRDAELLLQRSEARLARVTEAVPGVIFEVVQEHGGTWRTSFLSGQVEPVFGVPAAVLREDPSVLTGIVPEPEVDKVLAQLQRASAELRTTEFEVRLTRGGQTGWIRVRARHEAVEGGVRWTGFAVDVTEARRLQQQLHHSQRLEAMSSLAAGVAHNFNNMLGTILPNLEMALEDATPEQEPPLQDALTAGRSASQLVRQLLFASRGEGERPMTAVRVDEVLTEVHGICRRTFDAGIRLEVAIGPGPLTVRGSPSLLQQVVLNLLINARDAVADRPAPSIRLRARPSPDEAWVVIEVVDNGTGMPPEVLERLGEPFFTTKPIGRGTGLGLASVYGIVSDLGGAVEVESEVDRGTTFRVRLPCTGPASPTLARAEPGRVHLAGRRVLLVADEILVRRAVARLLHRRGHLVIEASSGDEGLAALDASIDAVLLDLSMPGMSGRQTLAAIKTRHQDVPVAVVTGHVDDLPALDLADAVLRKPLTEAALLSWLGETLT